MVRSDLRQMMRDAIAPRLLCRVYMRYDPDCWYYFPVLASDRLFCGAEENDFQLNGYTIRRFRDVDTVEIQNDISLRIDRAEGIPAQIVVPFIDVTDWKTVFASPFLQARNITVEQAFPRSEPVLAIGRLEALREDHILIRHFDGDGVWERTPMKLAYDDITSVSFGTRYVDTFSKYLPPLPANFLNELHNRD